MAGQITNGVMALYLDDSLQETSDVVGIILPVDPDTNEFLSLNLQTGKDFKGALDNIELYKPDSTPLLHIKNDDQTGTASTIQFDALGKASVKIISTGSLNQTHSSLLANRSVILSSSEGTSDFINLLTSTSYLELASAYATTIYDGDELPPIDDAALQDSASLNIYSPTTKMVAGICLLYTSPSPRDS